MTESLTKGKTMATKKTATKTTKLRPVLVTTLHRGVFFGFTSAKDGDETVRLGKCRNVLYWPTECKGFLGLAANGPVKGARLGPAVDSIELRDITSVTDMSAAVGSTFEAFPVWQ